MRKRIGVEFCLLVDFPVIYHSESVINLKFLLSLMKSGDVIAMLNVLLWVVKAVLWQNEVHVSVIVV